AERGRGRGRRHHGDGEGSHWLPSLPSALSSPAAASPPYPSAARIADSDCFPQYTASLKCLEANQDKSKCQQQFDDYKECKKREREARLERNKGRSLFG
ncbi:Os04g0665000, partial [Oryza sativa Japonica Group]